MIKLKIGSKDANINGVNCRMDTEPFLKDSRTFVPIRFVAEGMGLNVDWDKDTQEVTIYGRKKYFETADDCAFDWAMHWNAVSIALFKEMCGVIYKDDKGYYWGAVRIGQDKEVVYDTFEARQGVAVIHSHSGGKHSDTKSMSYGDFATSKKLNRPMYMADSGGCLWVYNPKEDKPKQRLVREGAPKDARWMDIEDSSTKQKEYFSKGYYPLDEFEYGYKADYFNKLHMNNKNYLKEEVL